MADGISGTSPVTGLGLSFVAGPQPALRHSCDQSAAVMDNPLV